MKQHLNLFRKSDSKDSIINNFLQLLLIISSLYYFKRKFIYFKKSDLNENL